MKPKYILESFANQTTMHGVPKVILAKSPFIRFFWSMVCITAGAIFCFQISEVLRRFFSYPKKVTVEVVSTPVPFPSVSLCNMRNLDFYILNTLNRKFLEDPHPINHINDTDNPFIREYMKIVAKYGPLWYKYQETHPQIFQEIFSRTTFSANIPQELISSAAVQLNEFIVTCYFGGNNCNTTKDFSTFFDPYYFNCFTYNAPYSSPEDDFENLDYLNADDLGDKILSLSEGIENGWSVIVLSGSGMLDKNPDIRVLPGIHESRSAVAASEGIRVVIHPPHTQPFPFAEGYDVPPGYSASFGIRPRRNIRIGPPHGNCMHRNPFGSAVKERYRGISCQKMCLQSHVIKNCDCYDASLPKLLNVAQKPCRRNDEIPDSCMFEASDECFNASVLMYDRIQCARETRDYVTRNTTLMSECLCHPPCNEFLYDVSYSLSKWPASGYEGDAAYLDVFYVEEFRQRFENTPKNQTIMEYFNDTNRESTMKDFARLNVYIADSNVIKTQETPDYTPNQLVSDIGGQLGIWVGISVITLTEVMEMICMLFRYFMTSKVPTPSDNPGIDGSLSDGAGGSGSSTTHDFRENMRNGKYNINQPRPCDDNGSGPRRCPGSDGVTGGVAEVGLQYRTWTRDENNYPPNEYNPYVQTSSIDRYTFEPIERDRSAMFRTYFMEPFFK